MTADDSATLRALITRAESASPPPSNLVGAKAKLAEINAEIDGAKPAPAPPAEPSAAPAIAPLRVPRGQTADAFPSSPDAITTTDAPMTARTAEMVSPRSAPQSRRFNCHISAIYRAVVRPAAAAPPDRRTPATISAI